MDVTVGEYLRFALEPIALANERVDHVDLDRWVDGQVRDRARRVHVEEDEVLVIPHGQRALRGDVGRPVLAHGGDEAERLLVHDAPHVVVKAHRSSSPRRSCRPLCLKPRPGALPRCRG